MLSTSCCQCSILFGCLLVGCWALEHIIDTPCQHQFKSVCQTMSSSSRSRSTPSRRSRRPSHSGRFVRVWFQAPSALWQFFIHWCFSSVGDRHTVRAWQSENLNSAMAKLENDGSTEGTRTASSQHEVHCIPASVSSDKCRGSLNLRS